MNSFTSAYFESSLKTDRDDSELPKARFHTADEIYETQDDAFYQPTVETKHTALNGETSLPKGYFWCKPEITQLNALAYHALKRENIKVERSRNIVKGLASVVQLVFSSITLYRARGSQLQRYGYAAFGLSVFPYTLMTFVNLVVFTIVCGTISGEIGTLPEATQSVDTVESPVEEDRNLNGGIGAGGIGEDGSGVPLMPEISLDYPRYQHYSAAYLRVEDDGVLVITMKGRTGRFKLIEGDDDDPLTFHFHVSALTNQEKAPKREKPQKSVSLIFFFFNLILIILLYVFISLLSGFRKRDSTSAQRGWIISWLVFNQVFSVYGLMFTFPDIGGPVQGVVLAVTILVLSIPAIGGFVMVGRMLFEFGTCSVL